MIPSNETLDQIHADLDELMAEDLLAEEYVDVVQQQLEEETGQTISSSDISSDVLNVVGEATSDPFIMQGILEGAGELLSGVGEAVGEVLGSILD